MISTGRGGGGTRIFGRRKAVHHVTARDLRGGGTRIFGRRKEEKDRKNGTRDQGIESARPLYLVHSLIVRRKREIICKRPGIFGIYF
jgi:hypothetical protein